MCFHANAMHSCKPDDIQIARQWSGRRATKIESCVGRRRVREFVLHAKRERIAW